MVHYLPAPPVPAEPAVDVARVEALEQSVADLLVITAELRAAAASATRTQSELVTHLIALSKHVRTVSVPAETRRTRPYLRERKTGDPVRFEERNQR